MLRNTGAIYHTATIRDYTGYNLASKGVLAYLDISSGKPKDMDPIARF